MNKLDEQKIKKLEAIINNDPSCFTEQENYVFFRRKSNVPFKQIAQELGISDAVARSRLKRRERRIAWAKDRINGIKISHLEVLEAQDFLVAYSSKGAHEIIRHLLPHVDEIKELTK